MTPMPEMKLKPVTPGKLNKPAWYSTRTGELGPDNRAGEGVASLVTAEDYRDGMLIGIGTGAPKAESNLRTWIPDCLSAGIKQHGNTLFNVIDPLVRTHRTELQQHPIAHLAAAV